MTSWGGVPGVPGCERVAAAGKRAARSGKGGRAGRALAALSLPACLPVCVGSYSSPVVAARDAMRYQGSSPGSGRAGAALLRAAHRFAYKRLGDGVAWAWRGPARAEAGRICTGCRAARSGRWARPVIALPCPPWAGPWIRASGAFLLARHPMEVDEAPSPPDMPRRVCPRVRYRER